MMSLAMFNDIFSNSSNTRRRDLKVRVLFEKASLFNARGLCNPCKVRRRVFELTSQTY